jgi:hypothetical protein
MTSPDAISAGAEMTGNHMPADRMALDQEGHDDERKKL